MIKTQQQLQEDFLRTCAKINGREYVSESEKYNQKETFETLAKRLEKVKQMFVDESKNLNFSNQMLTKGNDEATRMIRKIKDLAEHVERINSISINSRKYRSYCK